MAKPKPFRSFQALAKHFNVTDEPLKRISATKPAGDKPRPISPIGRR